MYSVNRNLFVDFAALVALSLIASHATAQDTKIDFAERQRAIKEKFENSQGKIDKLVHEPPMIKPAVSDLGDDEPVIGVSVNHEARAYPLVMLFSGGGIFELLNDTCGERPIAVSW